MPSDATPGSNSYKGGAPFNPFGKGYGGKGYGGKNFNDKGGKFAQKGQSKGAGDGGKNNTTAPIWPMGGSSTEAYNVTWPHDPWSQYDPWMGQQHCDSILPFICSVEGETELEEIVPDEPQIAGRNTLNSLTKAR